MSRQAGERIEAPGTAPPQGGAGPDFYAALPVVDSFARLTDPAVYAPLPSGWVLGLSDIVQKAGDFAVAPAAPGVRPDLDGLSCRFAEIPSQRGVILSLIVLPNPGAGPAAYADLIDQVLRLAEGGAEVGRPVPDGGPAMRWPPPGLELEARAARRIGRSLLATRLWVGFRTLVAHAVFRSGVTVGGFDPARYRRQLVQNTDFRKFDDGLRMTLDCTPALADRLEALLAAAEANGVARCGSHRQDAALMTCFVPSPTRSDHVHFVDGAMGGYSAAARAVKQAH